MFYLVQRISEYTISKRGQFGWSIQIGSCREARGPVSLPAWATLRRQNEL